MYLLLLYYFTFQDNFMNYVEKVPREPKISIGMPVHNSEKFIRRALDGLLSQTYSDFEIIISDNASTDFTPKICEEYIKKDKRIRYFRQEQDMGGHRNFMFVLQQAKCKYFKWVASDDIYLPDFLEKNISILESNENIIGSISRIERFGPKFNVLNDNPDDSFFAKIRKRIQRHLMTSLDVVSFSGSYKKKVRLFMRKRIPIMFYAIFRTDILKKSVMDTLFVNNDTSMCLNTLKYGDFHVINEILMHYYSDGLSSVGVYRGARLTNKGILGTIFPLYPFTFWFVKELGFKIFLRNLDCLILLNCVIEVLLVTELIFTFIHKIM